MWVNNVIYSLSILCHNDVCWVGGSQNVGPEPHNNVHSIQNESNLNKINYVRPKRTFSCVSDQNQQF